MRKIMTGLSLLLLPLLLNAGQGGGEGNGGTHNDGIVFETLTRSTTSWDGEKLPAYEGGQPEISIVRVVIAPGARVAHHKHTVINAGVLLRGELTVVSGNGDVLNMNAGDTVIELVDTWHYGFNHGSVPAELLVFYAGAEHKPVTLKR